MKISIVSPVYNAEKILHELVKRITEICELHKYEHELILVEDCSKDSSWESIIKLSKIYPNLKGYKLSRNFGQHYAITAGISNASGDLIIIMDCDLQDNPSYIYNLIEKSKEGYDVVCTIKNSSNHSFFRSASSSLFYKTLNLLSDVQLENNLGTMTLINRKVVSEYLKINDYHRHSNLLFKWLGFKRGFIFIDHQKRFQGESSYTLSKLFRHAVNGVISQSDKLLRWSITLGLIMFIASLMGVIFIVVKSFFHQFEVGWPSLVVLILFTTGILLLMLGILGLYIGKIFEQVKQRPLFIIEETTLK
jgi:glycosyltransferase involved in cell wall biosynthesis